MFGDPGPCPICGTAHTACRGLHDGNSDDVGKTRGVIVIQQMPARDAATSVTPQTAESKQNKRAERHKA